MSALLEEGLDPKVVNRVLCEKLGSTDWQQRKEAVDAANDYTRYKMREDGVLRKILPPVTITDDLDRMIEDDKPIKIIDKEPDSPAAVSVPFAMLPSNMYIKGPRYPVGFERIMTTRFTKDVSELRTWVMDIRQVFSDNAIKDMLAEEDAKWFRAVNNAIVGPGVILPTSGVAQYEQIGGGINRDSLWDMLKILPSTPSCLETKLAVCNMLTIKEVGKFRRDEMGGDLSMDVMRDGWSLQRFMGIDWIVTIKKDIVETNNIYLFADPKFLGKHFELEPVTMFIERKAFMIEFFAYEENGCTIGNTNAVARAEFI